MEIQPADVEYEDSWVRKERVEVSRLYEDGFLFLKGDPELWIQSNRGGCLSSVRSLELDFGFYEDRIGDSIGELSQLTHLCIRKGESGDYLKCLPNTISKLQNLHHLEFNCWFRLKELPANFGDCQNLASLTLNRCSSLKSLPNSIAKLSKLTTLNLTASSDLEELPANLGDLKLLTTLFLKGCDSLRSLPWSITMLSKLRSLYLSNLFILETLPPHMNDSIVISVDRTHVRKTWKKLKTKIQFPIIPVELVKEAPQETSTPGYFRFNVDPTPWIRGNYDLLSLVRFLDLNLGHFYFQGNIPDSIGELPQLTVLYISHGFLHRHPLPSNRITHLSLINCTFECDTHSHFDSLGKLSNLVSLHLNGRWTKDLPEHMDFPISLRHLTIAGLLSFPDNYMTSVAKLSNLETLNLDTHKKVESLPLDLNLNKLILRNSSINSIPIGLKHLEIIHGDNHVCWNQLVNLETLSYTCYETESFSSVASLHNLQELQLKDCFNLKELPPNLDELVKLCTLNVSGTRIKSLPNCVMKLHNLQRLILPKCINLGSLPRDFEYNVLISVDDTDESYYKYTGYHHPGYGINHERDYMTSDYIKEINEMFIKKFRQVSLTEQALPCRPLNHLPDYSHHAQLPEGSHFAGTKDPTSNNHHHAFSSSLNHEVECSPTGNEVGVVPSVNQYFSDIPGNTSQVPAPTEIEDYHLNGGNNRVSENNSHATFNLQNQEIQIGTSHSRNRDDVVTFMNATFAEPSSNVQETISCGENSQEAFRNGGMDNVTLESEQGIAPCDSFYPFHGRSDYHALENRQDKNSQIGYVKHGTQKKEVPLERIKELMSQKIRLEDAAENYLKVSRSTLKRTLKKHKLTWPSTRKRKNPDKFRNETHYAISSSGRILSQFNSVEPSNPAGLGQGARHLPSQLTMSDHVPSECNVVSESNSDVVIRTVGEPPMSTQCRMDGHLRVEEHPNGGKECALASTEIHPNERSSTFVVKATCNEDTARFNFSLSSSIEQLNEEVSKSLDLEVGTFKIKYQDDENEWMLMNRISDLELALSLSKASSSNVVRLLIILKT